jgi:hypothetical protein
MFSLTRIIGSVPIGTLQPTAIEIVGDFSCAGTAGGVQIELRIVGTPGAPTTTFSATTSTGGAGAHRQVRWASRPVSVRRRLVLPVGHLGAAAVDPVPHCCGREVRHREPERSTAAHAAFLVVEQRPEFVRSLASGTEFVARGPSAIESGLERPR